MGIAEYRVVENVHIMGDFKMIKGEIENWSRKQSVYLAKEADIIYFSNSIRSDMQYITINEFQDF